MREKIFIFKKNGDEYFILEEGELKDPSSRKWLPCVIYKSMKTGKIYSREKGEFLNKFVEKI